VPGGQLGVDKNVFTKPTYFTDEVHFTNSNNKLYLAGSVTFENDITFYGKTFMKEENFASNIYVRSNMFVESNLFINSNLYYRGDLLEPFTLRVGTMEGIAPIHMEDPADLPSLIVPGGQLGVDKNVFTKPTYFNDVQQRDDV
jgi:hypothetical protein